MILPSRSRRLADPCGGRVALWWLLVRTCQFEDSLKDLHSMNFHAATALHPRPPPNLSESCVLLVVAMRWISSVQAGPSNVALGLSGTAWPSTVKRGASSSDPASGSSGKRFEALTLSGSRGMPAFCASRSIHIKAMSDNGRSSLGDSGHPGGPRQSARQKKITGLEAQTHRLQYRHADPQTRPPRYLAYHRPRYHFGCCRAQSATQYLRN